MDFGRSRSLRTRQKSSDRARLRTCAPTLRARTPRPETMSHLKVLRGNIARQLYSCAKNGRRPKTNRVYPVRTLATQTAPNVDTKFLNSPWGEIQVDNQTLTDYVFADVESWPDKPSVVSFFTFSKPISKLTTRRKNTASLSFQPVTIVFILFNHKEDSTNIFKRQK